MGRLPAHVPLFRLALALIVLDAIVSRIAGSIGAAWLNLTLRGFSWVLGLAGSILLVRYVLVNRQRWISMVVNWIRLMKAVSSRDENAIQAAARQLEAESHRHSSPQP